MYTFDTLQMMPSIDGMMPVKRDREEDTESTGHLTQYRYIRHADDREIEGDWSLSRAHAYEMASKLTERVCIEKRHILKPSNDKILAYCFMHLLQKNINVMAGLRCFGCSVDHPSQTQHMSGGCLADAEEKLDLYYDEVNSTITDMQVKELYITLMRELRLEPNGGDSLQISEMRAKNYHQDLLLKSETFSTFSDAIDFFTSKQETAI